MILSISGYKLTLREFLSQKLDECILVFHVGSHSHCLDIGAEDIVFASDNLIAQIEDIVKVKDPKDNLICGYYRYELLVHGS